MIEQIIKAATCRVICDSKSGTGYLISDKIIITARHCVIDAIDDDSVINLSFPHPENTGNIRAVIVAHSEELDVCLLKVSQRLECSPIPLSGSLPREGDIWKSFGYPKGKTEIGHRITGTISHLLDTPKLKMDIDLTVDPNTALYESEGLSGAAVVSEGNSIGLLRVSLNGTLGAISIYQLTPFLKKNGIGISRVETDEATSGEKVNLADRSLFQNNFEEILASNSGNYIFLEGVHGVGKTTFCNVFYPKAHKIINLGSYSITSDSQGPGAIYRAQPEVFFDWLLTKVSAQLTGKTSSREERNYATLIRDTSAILQSFSDYCLSRDSLGVLFIDGLNEAQNASHETLIHLIGLLPQTLPQAITITLTAPNYKRVETALSGRVKINNIVSLPVLNDDAVSAFCWQNINKDKVSHTLVQQIVEKTKGHPLYLRYLIEYVNDNIGEEALDDFPSIAGNIEEYYEALWSDLIEDEDAINLLGLISRLRWGLSKADFLKVLTNQEQKAFIPTINRIQHLLLNPDITTIYHPSFSDFIVAKTSDFEMNVHKRLAAFCTKETGLDYCRLNEIYHLLRSNDNDRIKAINLCNQTWVDTCVNLGCEPDVLLLDIKEVIACAVCLESAAEVIRLLLLSQRVSFRYNHLFAQSARLITEALISLKRPKEAIKHVLRFNTLIVDHNEALQIAFCFIKNGYQDEALHLLFLLNKKLLEAYSHTGNTLDNFLITVRLQLKVLFFIRLAEGGGRTQQAVSILEYVVRLLRANLPDQSPEVIEDCYNRVHCVGTGFFLSFHDTYTDVAKLNNVAPGAKLPLSFLIHNLIWTLVECEENLTNFNLPKDITALPRIFDNLDTLIKSGANLDTQLITPVLDTLIQLGANTSIIQKIAEKGGQTYFNVIKVTQSNGVDVDFKNIHQSASEWRTAAFLNNDLECPLVGAFDQTNWLTSLDQIIRALYWCEGRARRAKADKDLLLLQHTLELLKSRVISPLSFTLTQRIDWEDSYAIPEVIFPLIYERATVLLVDCYPNELPLFLQGVSERVGEQLGLYTEGLREVIFAILEQLTVTDVDQSIFDAVHILLQQWRDHVLTGVENRHELVPELLKLIPFFVKIGANEEAERLYEHMLSVSMGPSWYKEDQLALLVSTLRDMPLSDDVRSQLPLIAGYLERASGEMTFQRYVRYEKENLLGELFRRGKTVNACRYFKRQSCGTPAELYADAQRSNIDRIHPMIGMRFPGGALDEQHAILEIVKNTNGIDLRLRWALLEIFQFGDERHIDDYASEYAKLINQTGSGSSITPEMFHRIKVLIEADLSPDDRDKFITSFINSLDDIHDDLISITFPEFPKASSSHVFFERQNADAEKDNFKDVDIGSDDEDKLFYPGIFGHKSALRDSENELDKAEHELKLDNIKAAKNKAAEALRILQKGGWSIWGTLSNSSARIENILLKDENDANNVIRYYGPLLEAELYDHDWRLAEHLITKLLSLFNEKERTDILQYVVDHVALMVGEASEDIAAFDFLGNDAPCNQAVEVFNLVLWLLDHPKHLRRTKAAELVAWLIEMEPLYLDEAVRIAFSMEAGCKADIICGVLDGISNNHPKMLWNQVINSLAAEDILDKCKHVGRLTVLHRISERAADAGLQAAGQFVSRIEEQFRSGLIELGISEALPPIPKWAHCLKYDWDILHNIGLLSNEVLKNVEIKLAQIYSPLDVNGGFDLERIVSTNFRDHVAKFLNRWDANVRYALSSALFPYVSKRNFREVESTLRVFNPSLPERSLTSGVDTPSEAILHAFDAGEDYSSANGDQDNFYLNFHELIKHPDERRWIHIEVLAIVVSESSRVEGAEPGSSNTSFTSREIPRLNPMTPPSETCCRLRPAIAFFGSFTPAYPLPAFIHSMNANESDFTRISWRDGRSKEVDSFGRALREGCLLGVKRNAIHLPQGKKLAWIIYINRKIVSIIDSDKNRLV